jgi:aspartokinase/homoserine dehydrogenase 1
LAGDEFHSISGVLSGTLSFVFARLREGERFSQAVADARDLGLTEPHPGADLAGADVGRKLLILMREAGYAMEPGDIPVESLIPSGLSDEGRPDAFLTQLASLDGEWAERVGKARNRGEFLSYVAWHDGRDGGVGIRSLPQDHPLACPRPTENVVLLETDRYSPVPLAVTGPGAGPELTATGVLTDLLAAIREGGLTYGRLP